MKKKKLIGRLSIPNLPSDLEGKIFEFQEMYGIQKKSDAAKILMREGLKSVGEKKELVIGPVF